MNPNNKTKTLVICWAALATLLFAQGSRAGIIEVTFDDLDPAGAGILKDQTVEFIITNDTGISWTDFHIKIENVGGWDLASYAGPGNPSGMDTDGGVGGLFSEIGIFDISIPTSELLSFSINYVCGIAEVCGLGTAISFFPTIDGEPPTTSVPEPSTLALFGLGLMGLVLARRKKV